MYVKFVKGHPKFAYFVGDVVELSKEVLKEEKLHEGGYTIPADDDEILAAKKAEETAKVVSPRNVAGFVGLQNLVEDQAKQIQELLLMANKPSGVKPPVVPPVS